MRKKTERRFCLFRFLIKLLPRDEEGELNDRAFA